jgi:tRNA1Val (adenine37-N6)-methyltransferase
VADLGTGSGVLPVILARHQKVESITGIEIQKELADLAEKNISHNNCQKKVSIKCSDIKKVPEEFSPESFDMVITNPPFYSLGAGRINPDSENAIARHEIKGTLDDFIAGSSFLLKSGGSFFAVYRPARLADLVSEMRKNRIEPKAFQFVHPKKTESANIVLVEGIKGAGTETIILPPLMLYKEDGKYTEQANAVFENI